MHAARPALDALAPVPEAAPPDIGASEASIPLPSAGELGISVLGFAALGICGALGAEPGTALQVAPTALIAGVGALGLTAPALLVGHQILDLSAPIGSLAGALGQSFRRAGGLALGLSPMVLFFAATSGLAKGLLVLALAGLAVASLAHAYSGLLGCEHGAGTENRLQRQVKMHGLVSAWMVLTGLIGLRIALHLVGV